MVRKDKDQVWRRLEDGTMELVSEIEVIREDIEQPTEMELLQQKIAELQQKIAELEKVIDTMLNGGEANE